MPTVREPDQTKMSEKGGKPSAITTDHLKLIEHLAGLGLTIRSIAVACDTTEGVFHTYLRDETNPVYVALEKGKMKAHKAIAKTIYHKAVEGDMQAAKWWEQSRMRMTAATEVTLSGGERPIQMQVAHYNVAQIQQASSLLVELLDDPEVARALEGSETTQPDSGNLQESHTNSLEPRQIVVETPRRPKEDLPNTKTQQLP